MAIKTRHRCLICGAVKPSKFGDCSEDAGHTYDRQLSDTIASETNLLFTMPDFKVGHAVGKQRCVVCGDKKPCRLLHSNLVNRNGNHGTQYIPISNLKAEDTHIAVCASCYGKYKTDFVNNGWSLCSCEKVK